MNARAPWRGASGSEKLIKVPLRREGIVLAGDVYVLLTLCVLVGVHVTSKEFSRPRRTDGQRQS